MTYKETQLATREEITQIIFSAIDEVNLMLPKDRRLEKSFQTTLSGDSAALDSLGLINLIVDLCNNKC